MKRSLFGPAGLLVGSALLGGWLLQDGVSRDRNLYEQARVFQEVIDRVSRDYVEELPEGMLYEDAVDGILESLDDPYSYVFEPESYEQFRIQTEGEYAGVGMEVSVRGGFVTVVAPVPGGPAEAQGVRAGDQIVVVEGESAEGWSIDRMVAALMGRAGTSVSVEIRRPGMDANIPLTLKRANIQIRAIPFTTVLEPGIGYIPVQMFREMVTRELRAALDSMVAGGVRTVILDFRGNPGGLLEEGIAVTDLFLPAGAPIVRTRGRSDADGEAFTADSPNQYEDLEVLLLVDERSASASEILAGALQDHDRATLVGTRTFGKGSVQSLYPLSGGKALKLTTARWYTPSGRSIQPTDEERERFREGLVATLDARSVARNRVEGRPTFLSFGGDTLYGGGGITPDEIVLPDTISVRELEALTDIHGAAPDYYSRLFDFAVEYLQTHPDLPVEFELEPPVLASFGVFLTRDQDREIDDATLAAASRPVLFQIGLEIAKKRGGAEGAFHWSARHDPQLDRALAIARGDRSEVEPPAAGG